MQGEETVLIASLKNITVNDHKIFQTKFYFSESLTLECVLDTRNNCFVVKEITALENLFFAIMLRSKDIDSKMFRMIFWLQHLNRLSSNNLGFFYHERYSKYCNPYLSEKYPVRSAEKSKIISIEEKILPLCLAEGKVIKEEYQIFYFLLNFIRLNLGNLDIYYQQNFINACELQLNQSGEIKAEFYYYLVFVLKFFQIDLPDINKQSPNLNAFGAKKLSANKIYEKFLFAMLQVKEKLKNPLLDNSRIDNIMQQALRECERLGFIHQLISNIIYLTKNTQTIRSGLELVQKSQYRRSEYLIQAVMKLLIDHKIDYKIQSDFILATFYQVPLKNIQLTLNLFFNSSEKQIKKSLNQYFRPSRKI